MVDYREVNGARLAFEVTGKGPPLLLLHGAQGGRRMMAPLMAQLSSDFTTISFDQRDCGETLNPSSGTTLSVLADDAAALLRLLGLAPAHVFGTSFGGRLAQCLAIEHPDVVCRLALGSTWPAPTPLKDLDPKGAAHFALIRSSLPESSREFVELFVPSAHLEENPLLHDLVLGTSDEPMRAARRQAAIQSAGGDPARIRVPTLVLAGLDDRIVPPALGRELQRRIAGAAFHGMSGVGHLPTLQAPQLVATVLREFLLSDQPAA